MTVNGPGFSFWSNENVLKLTVTQVWEKTKKNIELYTLNG